MHISKPYFFLMLIIGAVFCKKKITFIEAPRDIVYKKTLNNYTTVQYGNMPLIISVPHGGSDGKVIELANAIDSICKTTYNVQPYLVYSTLKRIKIDQNRTFPEATCSNNALLPIWNDYHLSIDSFISKITLKYPQILFIDLHGHGHPKQRLELGYLISDDNLRNPSSINPTTTSCNNLILQNTFLNSNQFITTVNSFGTLMTNRNFPSVPSMQNPAPLVTDPYFDGGPNTKLYTSPNYPKVYGWQIETNYTGVRDNQTSINNFAKAFLQSVMEFYALKTSMKPYTFGK